MLLGDNPIHISGSITISVEDLIDKVNEIYSDILPNDLLIRDFNYVENAKKYLITKSIRLCVIKQVPCCNLRHSQSFL